MTRSRIAIEGQIVQPDTIVRGIPMRSSCCEEAFPLPLDQRALVLAGRAHVDEHALHLARPVVDGPREDHRDLAIGLEIRHHVREATRPPRRRHVRAVVLDLDGGGTRAVRLEALVPRPEMDREAFLEEGGQLPSIIELRQYSRLKDVLGSARVRQRPVRNVRDPSPRRTP